MTYVSGTGTYKMLLIQGSRRKKVLIALWLLGILNKLFLNAIQLTQKLYKTYIEKLTTEI